MSTINDTSSPSTCAAAISVFGSLNSSPTGANIYVSQGDISVVNRVRQLAMANVSDGDNIVPSWEIVAAAIDALRTCIADGYVMNSPSLYKQLYN